MFCSVGHGQLLLLACLAVESQLGLCLPVFGSGQQLRASLRLILVVRPFSLLLFLFLLFASAPECEHCAVSVSEAIKEVP